MFDEKDRIDSEKFTHTHTHTHALTCVADKWMNKSILDIAYNKKKYIYFRVGILKIF